jgi:uncharacterized protein
VVSELGDLASAHGSGYISAFPASFLDRLEAITPVWAPYQPYPYPYPYP